MRAYVEVTPGNWRYLDMPPGPMLRRVIAAQGRAPCEATLRDAARRFVYTEDPLEIWPHPVTMLKGTGPIRNDCEDWTRIACYYGMDFQPQILEMAPGRHHARPINAIGAFDWSGIRQLYGKAKSKASRTYLQSALRDLQKVAPYATALLTGNPLPLLLEL